MTHLPRKEGLEVLREFRKQREQAKQFDFSLGPPDVTGLEGPERLSVLRSYRQYLQARDSSFEAPATNHKPAGVYNGKKDDGNTPRAPPAADVAPWLKENSPAQVLNLSALPVDVSDDPGPPPATVSKMAGLVSGAHGSQYTYFERPITERDVARKHPTTESQPAPPSPRASQAIEATVRAEALEGAAGVQSSQAGDSALLGAWLEADTPRNCRKLVNKDGANNDTTHRIFAPDIQPDEGQADAVKSRAKQMLELRQARQAQELAQKLAAAETHPIAGVSTSLSVAAEGGMAAAVPGAFGAPNAPPAEMMPAGTPRAPAYQTEYALATAAAAGQPPPTPRGGAEMPSTVGMSRAAVLEAKRAWRLTMRGDSAPPTPRGAPTGVVAGISSEYRTRTVRGQVGALDPGSAADYNLQVKLTRGVEGLTPRANSNATVAPWLGGDEKMEFGVPKNAPTYTDVSDDLPPAGAPLGDVSNRAAGQLAGQGLQGAAVLPPATACVPPTPTTAGLEGLSHAEKLQRMRELRQASMAAPGTPRSSALVAGQP